MVQGEEDLVLHTLPDRVRVRPGGARSERRRGRRSGRRAPLGTRGGGRGRGPLADGVARRGRGRRELRGPRERERGRRELVGPRGRGRELQHGARRRQVPRAGPVGHAEGPLGPSRVVQEPHQGIHLRGRPGYDLQRAEQLLPPALPVLHGRPRRALLRQRGVGPHEGRLQPPRVVQGPDQGLALRGGPGRPAQGPRLQVPLPQAVRAACLGLPVAVLHERHADDGVRAGAGEGPAQEAREHLRVRRVRRVQRRARGPPGGGRSGRG
mmetsp:Transcript_68215/g.192313  ORF Transcript_68215/g.192313 Transcript_68215/m.192313 type:complete len:267 (-) Transcript_68215:612-1412(-)